MNPLQSILQSIDIVESRLAEQSSKSLYAQKADSSPGKKGAPKQHQNQVVDRAKATESPSSDVNSDDKDEGCMGTAETLFDASQRCMYLQIQGDGYYQLFQAKNHSEHVLLEFASRALAAYEAATDLASSSLDATDPLRLLVVTTYCHALHTLPTLSTDIRNEFSSIKKAKKLAIKTYNNASSFPVSLTDEAIYLLQVLRDKWVVAGPTIHQNDTRFHQNIKSNQNIGNTINAASDTDGDALSEESDSQSEDGEEQETKEERKERELHEAAMDNVQLAAEQKHRKKLQDESKARIVANAKRVKDGGKPAQSLGKKNTNENIHSLGVFSAQETPQDKKHVTARARSAQRDIRRLRAICSPLVIGPDGHSIKHEPILLDRDVSHAPHLRAALKRIFNIYVQGSAVVGLQSQGHLVELPDAQVMSIGNFLLQGPFIGFRGFISILRDFGLCKLPLNEKQWKKRLAKSTGKSKGKYYGDGKFPNIFDANDAVHLFHNGTPPLNIKEATMLFIECSRSAKPVLTMTKYLSNYEKIALEMDALEDSFAQPLAWAAEPVDSWGTVNCGLNFMQFLDFIGKASVVSYSAERFESILTSDIEKVEHFLHAQMGLLDPRRWLPKVEGRLHSMKVQLEQALTLHDDPIETTGLTQSKGEMARTQTPRRDPQNSTRRLVSVIRK